MMRALLAAGAVVSLVGLPRCVGPGDPLPDLADGAIRCPNAGACEPCGVDVDDDLATVGAPGGALSAVEADTSAGAGGAGGGP